MRGNSTIFNIYATGVMLLLLYSLYAYFLWWMHDGMMYIFLLDFFVAILGLIYIETRKMPVRLTSKVIIPFLGVWFVEALNPMGIVMIISKCPLSLLTILLLDKNSLHRLMKVWTNLYAVILSISLIAWLLALQNIIPSYGIISFANVDAYVYHNYILCLVNANILNFDTIRFCSIFLEPGHISMIGAFTLYLNRYDFKKWTTWAILIASLASLSLAGYVLVIIGYLMIRIQKSSLQKEISSIVLSSILLISAYYIAISYNNGDNLVNTLIIQRTEYDSEKGIVGNNRTSLETDRTFDYFMQSSHVFTGYDFKTYTRYQKEATISGAGYKMYLMEKGILGTFIILLVYLYIARRGLDKRYLYFFLLLYIISFIQRSWPTSHIWLFLFVFATAVQKPGELYKSKIKVKSLVSH